jgi:N-acetyl-anhydromuramyl-L-alanine amidase AmpD
MAYKKLNPFDIKSDKLEFVPFSADQYVPESTDKKQIVLHHTVSDPTNSKGDIAWWLQSTERVATALTVQADGKAFQCFSSRLWAWHIGAGNTDLERGSIGIELDNWGGLTKKDDGLYNVYGNKMNIKDDELVYFPEAYRKYHYFQKYTEAQLDTVGELLLLWNQTYGIPLTYNEDMWDISEKALSGTPGIWAHVSYIKQKSDAFPQPELVEMLKSLSIWHK